jgi:hypothetical protein
MIHLAEYNQVHRRVDPDVVDYYKKYPLDPESLDGLTSGHLARWLQSKTSTTIK